MVWDKNKQDRGQAYAFEATIAALLIVIGVMFIVPGITTPISENNINEQKLEAEVSNDVEQMLKMHKHNGHLKSLILNYESGQWGLSHPTNEEYDVGPSERPLRVSSESDDYRYFVQGVPGPVGKSIEDIKNKHDVWVTIKLVPAKDSSRTSNDEIMFMEDNVRNDVLTHESTTVVLHENDKLKSTPEAHSLYGSTSTVSSGDGLMLNETENIDDFVIGEDENTSDSGVYNSVKVKITVYEEGAR